MTSTETQPLSFRVNISNRHVMVRPFPHAELPRGVRAMARVEEPRWADTPSWLGTIFEYATGTFGACRLGRKAEVVKPTLRQALMWLLDIDNVDELMPLLGELEVARAELYPAEEIPFIPSRFPFTYSADCLRSFPKLAPEDVAEGYEEFPPLSRSGSAGLQRKWAAEKGLNRSVLAVALATVYCRANGITVSSSRYLAVLAGIREGKADADL